MGVLSDLVAAPATDADRIANSVNPAAEFGGIDIKGIDSVKFGTLHAILTGRSFEDLLPEYDPVVTVSDDGPWLFRLPTELVVRLASLAGGDERAVVSRWAATEEFALDGWSASDVARALDEIVALARKGLDAGHSLFLWMSL
jgi:hypothetical protein